MAWIAGVTRTTGDLITAADWNNYLGAAGSLDYLKTETEKLDDVSHAEPSRALDTIYQNGAKIRIITVSLHLGDLDLIYVHIGSGTPPTTIVAQAYNTIADSFYMPISFVVPPNWYYRVWDAAGAPSFQDWHEWDLH